MKKLLLGLALSLLAVVGQAAQRPSNFKYSVPVAACPAGRGSGFCRPDYAQRILADSPVAYWRLNEAAGSTTAADLSGNGYTGTKAGGVTFGVASPQPDGSTAASSTGVDGSHVAIPATDVSPGGPLAAIQGTSAITIEGWFNATTMTFPANYRLGISFVGQGSSYMGFYDGFVGPTGVHPLAKLNIGGSQQGIGDVGPALTAGTWYLLDATYDGASMKLYENGVQIGTTLSASGTLDLGLGSHGMYIVGYVGTGGPYGWNGGMSNVAVYNYALTATQILDHWRIGQ